MGSCTAMVTDICWTIWWFAADHLHTSMNQYSFCTRLPSTVIYGSNCALCNISVLTHFLATQLETLCELDWSISGTGASDTAWNARWNWTLGSSCNRCDCVLCKSMWAVHESYDHINDWAHCCSIGLEYNACDPQERDYNQLWQFSVSLYLDISDISRSTHIISLQ